MVKEGEGGVKEQAVEKKDSRSTLQQVTGRGKETEGISYPVPSLNVIAALEQVYGDMANIPEKELNAQALRLMIYLLEIQKDGKDDQLAVMNRGELLAAAGKLIKEKGIDMDNFADYMAAAQAVFTRSRRRMRGR